MFHGSFFRSVRLLFSFSLVALAAAVAAAQEKSVAPGINKPYETGSVQEFLGRFEVESREVFVQRKQIAAACRIKPGMIVGDIGAGTGLFTRMFAAEVGPKGTVYAVDITPKFIEHVRKTCREAGIRNVKTVLSTATSIELPSASIDLAFLCDVYHHFEYPQKVMASVHRALRPGGQLVVVDFCRIEGKTPESLMKHVRAGQEVVTREIEAAGFKLVPQEAGFIKENYLIRFERVEQPKEPASAPKSENRDTPPQASGLKPQASLESPALLVQIDSQTGRWSLLDKRAGVRWPTSGTAAPGLAKALEGPPRQVEAVERSIRLHYAGDAAVVFELVDDGRSLAIRYEGKDMGDVRTLDDVLAITDQESGGLIVPCREGLWIPATSGVAFRYTFGTSDYEGCHMNMLGLVKSGAALVTSWDDAYVWADVASILTKGQSPKQQVSASLKLGTVPIFGQGREASGRKWDCPPPPPARLVRLTPLGRGDWNTVAEGYRRLAEQKGLAVTLREKIRREPHAERLLVAANVKLWTCLHRRMNDESTKEEFVKVCWTFDEAARIAEHVRKDLDIGRCLFTIGGWTEGGYDCRHPDNLPANRECGGNEALAAAIRRIQALGFVACLHDNYQDMYRDAKSWSPDDIQKHANGSLMVGGRWLGGRAYLVCAPKAVELAMRPQNLPAIHKLLCPWCYFIDTTYAAGPQECHDPKHPLDRNGDIAWKGRLSDEARRLFGMFGSECGREWALPHSDFFEGLVGVGGNYYHTIRPEEFGARVIPFWEMVYHDCQVCYGKYGYSAEGAAEYVAHHVLAARPLHYHSVPEHLYFARAWDAKRSSAPRACFTRTDRGWAEKLHPADAFLKNTHEVLGPLNLATAHDRVTSLEFLAPDGSVRRAVYGRGDTAVTVQVNFGPKEAAVTSRYGGAGRLPPWGFVIDGPRLAAFYAKSWNGREYPDGAMFTLQAIEGDDLSRATKVRVFHAFGDPKLAWRSATHDVPREQVVAAGP